jgi:hypothetical protein
MSDELNMVNTVDSTVEVEEEDNGFRPNADDDSQPLASARNPQTSATITVRIIKSFEYRTFKAMVLKEVNLEEMTVGQLMDKVREGECFSTSREM